MKRIFFLFALLTAFFSTSQQEGFVLDSTSKESLPFVNILVDNGPIGTTTNIDGKFKLKETNGNSLRFSFVGYEDKIISNFKNHDTVYLVQSKSQLQEIEILPGINPAHRIIKLCSKKRKENNPNNNINYSLETYNKFIFTGDQDALSKIENKDSSEIRLTETLERQHLFLIESVSETKHHKVTGSQNNILASKTSGLQNPIVAALFTQLQTFSFYDNVLELGGNSFISPLAPGGPQRYLYILEDSIQNDNSYTYIIRYQPKRNKNFDGLKGTVYINSENYAIEKILASPVKDIQGATVSILQGYNKIDKYWFAQELYTDIEIKNITANNAPLKGIGKSYIRNVELNTKVKFGNNGFSLQVEDDAPERDSLYWEKRRIDTITVKELETYRIVDSLAKEQNIEKRIQMINSILAGKIPIKFIDIDLIRLVDYDPVQGFMLGLGLHTNDLLSKKVHFGGFLTYGFKDKKVKYGGDITFHLYRKRRLFLNISYSDDIVDRGGREFIYSPNIFQSSAGYNGIFDAAKEYSRKLEVRLGGYVRGNVRMQLFSNYQRHYFYDDYRYINNDQTENSNDKFDLFEVGLSGKWTIKEKVIQSQGTIISLGSKYPTIQMKYTQGIKGVINSRYSYSNIQLQINQDFKFRGWATLYLQLNGNMTIGNTPISNLHFENGTYFKVGISVQNSFETMKPGKFLSDKSASLFATLAFNDIKTGKKWSSPQFSISSAAGYGSLSNSNFHTNYSFQTLDKGYFESGLIVNNIFKLSFLGFGAGVFYKYGSYASIYEKNNFAYKIALKINF